MVGDKAMQKDLHWRALLCCTTAEALNHVCEARTLLTLAVHGHE